MNLFCFYLRVKMNMIVLCLYFIGVVAAFDVKNCAGTAKRGDGITCYEVPKIEGTFLDARAHCKEIGMDLVSIVSEEEKNAIIKLMSDNAISEIWINLNLTSNTWKWPDGSELAEQGCYLSSESMSLKGNKVSNNSFLACSEDCKDSKYVGLMRGTLCFCGNQFGEDGQMNAQCSTMCPSSATENCGGNESQRIVAINGLYSNWAFAQPNDGGLDRERQRCSIIEDTLSWNDIGCNSQYYAICEIILSPEMFPTCDEKEKGVHSISTSSSDACIYITDKPLPYLEAVRECSRFNGSLLKIPNKLFNDALKPILPKNYSYWIGATRFKQVWLSGESVTYTSWLNADLRPGYGFAKRDDSTPNPLPWGTADGSQKKFIMCQKTNATFAYMPSYFTVSTTTTSSPQTKYIITPPTTTTIPLQPTNDSTTRSDINSTGSKLSGEAIYGIIGGVIGGGVLLIIPTIVLIIVICKRKRETPAMITLDDEESVKPSYFFDLTSDTLKSKDSISKSNADSVSIDSTTLPPPPYNIEFELIHT